MTYCLTCLEWLLYKDKKQVNICQYFKDVDKRAILHTVIGIKIGSNTMENIISESKRNKNRKKIIQLIPLLGIHINNKNTGSRYM